MIIDIKRRSVDITERNYLRDRRVVSETQADLGLTAVLSSQILDLFFNDFPEKYEEYLAAQSERKEQAYKSSAKPAAQQPIKSSLLTTPAEKKPFDPRLRAMKATAKWNSMFNKERVEERYSFPQSYKSFIFTYNWRTRLAQWLVSLLATKSAPVRSPPQSKAFFFFFSFFLFFFFFFFSFN